MTRRPLVLLTLASLFAVGVAAHSATTAGPAKPAAFATKARGPASLTVCHSTRSKSTPYLRVVLPGRAVSQPQSRAGRELRRYLRHRGDLIIVGAASCPSAAPVKLVASLRPVTGGTGSGTIDFTIRLATRELCYTVTLTGVRNVTDADVLRVSSGAVAVKLWAVTTPSVGSSTVCDTYARSLLREIVGSPSAFVVVVRTGSFPAGELRGRLAR